MMIERFYYDEAIREWEEIKKECDAEYALLTEAEKQKEKEKIRKEADRIIQKAEMKMSMEQKVSDFAKIKKFKEMIPEILKMAETSNMNVRIEMENLFRAHVKLETGYITMLAESPKEEKNIILDMIREAGDIQGCVKDDLMQYDFYFDFFIS